MTAVVLILSFQAMLADDYAVREHGSRLAHHLIRSRPYSCQPIAVAVAHHPSPEVRSRCSRLYGYWRAHLAAVYVPTGIPMWPCVDMLPHDYPDRWGVVSHYRSLASNDSLIDGGPPYWRSWRRATEMLVRDLIRDGWEYVEADSLLQRMWSIELAYHERLYPQYVPLVETWMRWGWCGYPE